MTPVPSKAGISSSPEAESSCTYPSERPVSSRAASAASHSSGVSVRRSYGNFLRSPQGVYCAMSDTSTVPGAKVSAIQ